MLIHLKTKEKYLKNENGWQKEDNKDNYNVLANKTKQCTMQKFLFGRLRFFIFEHNNNIL